MVLSKFGMVGKCTLPLWIFAFRSLLHAAVWKMLTLTVAVMV